LEEVKNTHSRRLILLRHAHRDVTDRRLDNGLSEKGKEQASLLARYFQQALQGMSDLKIESSPKKRCQETLEQTSRVVRTEMSVNLDLDECGQNENDTQFQGRVSEYLERWKKSKESNRLICSHGDWIPTAAALSLKISVDLRKAGWLVLSYSNEGWVCEEVFQSPEEALNTLSS